MMTIYTDMFEHYSGMSDPEVSEFFGGRVPGKNRSAAVKTLRPSHMRRLRRSRRRWASAGYGY